jgi:outer membrane protein assembly factor BamB
MSFHAGKQRRGKASSWAIGLLALVYLTLTGYQYRVTHTPQEEDEQRVKDLHSAPLKGVKYQADPNDWSQWRGPNRDGTTSGKGIIQEWPGGGPPVLWRVTGGPGLSSLAATHDRVVTLIQQGDNEAVVCLDAGTGKSLWQHAYPSRFSVEALGPRSTPTIDADRVYTVGAMGDLYCLDLSSGQVCWHRDLKKEFNAPVPRWGFSFSPLVEGDLLLICPGGPEGNSVAALNKKTGDIVWKALDDPAGYSSPVMSDAQGVRQVLFLTGTALVGLDPENGKLLWRFPWAAPHEANVATPIVRGDYVFISSGYNMGCAMLKVVKSGEGLAVEQVYRNKLMRNHFSSCVLLGDYLYGFDEGYLTCIPFREGKPRGWKERKFYRGNLLAAGELLIVLGYSGNLALVGPDLEAYREKGMVQLLEGRCWACPALAHGRLYLRDDRDIVCLDLRKK